MLELFGLTGCDDSSGLWLTVGALACRQIGPTYQSREKQQWRLENDGVAVHSAALSLALSTRFKNKISKCNQCIRKELTEGKFKMRLHFFNNTYEAAT